MTRALTDRLGRRARRTRCRRARGGTAPRPDPHHRQPGRLVDGYEHRGRLPPAAHRRPRLRRSFRTLGLGRPQTLLSPGGRQPPREPAPASTAPPPAALAFEVIDRRPHFVSVPIRRLAADRQPRHARAPAHGDDLQRQARRAVVEAQGQEPPGQRHRGKLVHRRGSIIPQGGSAMSLAKASMRLLAGVRQHDVPAAVAGAG